MNNKEWISAMVLGGFLMVGLILAGWLLGAEIKETRLADHYVTVKGLVERRVKSDTAIWVLNFKETGSDLPQVFAKGEQDQQAVLKFLLAQDVTQPEISLGQVEVTDKPGTVPRYILEQAITVSSGDVDKIAKAGQKIGELVQTGISLGGGHGIRYRLNGLNRLKPEMLTEATKNARASANRFAVDSGSHVGSIRSANQGVFLVTGGDDDAEGSGSGNADSSIMKKVRVVTTVDYYLVR